MKTFNGREYLQIDIANCFGLDRLNWEDRLHWFDNNEPDLEQLRSLAKSPVLYGKAVRAWREGCSGKPINHNMGLDATASGVQIMACLSGCVKTGLAVNLVNTGNREDLYERMATTMSQHPNVTTNRDELKKPTMTVFYGSTAQPREILGEGDALEAFYETLATELPGAYFLVDVLQSYWRPDVEFHRWTLPDGHVARVPVTRVVEKSLEIDEANHKRVTYRCKVVHPAPYSRSLAANIVHSIDAWVCRQMVQASKKQGFWMAPIHDCFYAHPNHMNQVRENYVKILSWLAQNNILQGILSEIAGRRVKYKPEQSHLDYYIEHSEYALS